MEGESGEQVVGELESVTSSAGFFMQGWRNEKTSGDGTHGTAKITAQKQEVRFFMKMF